MIQGKPPIENVTELKKKKKNNKIRLGGNSKRNSN